MKATFLQACVQGIYYEMTSRKPWISLWGSADSLETVEGKSLTFSGRKRMQSLGKVRASWGRENIGQPNIIATCRLAIMVQIKSVPPLPLSNYYNCNLYILYLNYFSIQNEVEQNTYRQSMRGSRVDRACTPNYFRSSLTLDWGFTRDVASEPLITHLLW